MSFDFDFENYTTPDVELFKSRFPAFNLVDNALVELVMQECVHFIDGGNEENRSLWNANDYQPAILYLTAHKLVQEGYPSLSRSVSSSSDSTTTTSYSSTIYGQVVKEKVGDVEIHYSPKIDVNEVSTSTARSSDNLNASDASLSTTFYGKEFVKLRNINFNLNYPVVTNSLFVV